MNKLPAPIIVILTFLGLFFLMFSGLAIVGVVFDLSKIGGAASVLFDLGLATVCVLLSSLCFSVLIFEVRDK